LGVLPDIDLVKGVAMGTDKFVEGFAEGKVADL
jgi:hypothetical protein